MAEIKVVAFTGHRPESMTRNPITQEKLAFEVGKVLRQAINDVYHKYGARTFISGMARGVDTWAAQQVLFLRDTHDNPGEPIRLICATVHQQTALWSKEDKETYDRILAKADQVEIIGDGQDVRADLLQRNRWMVDNSEMLIAVWNGKPGGTKYTIDYAEKKHRPIWTMDLSKIPAELLR